MYKFLLYKIFRCAKAQEKSVDVNFGFIGLVIVFELLHFTIFAVFFKIIGLEINLVNKELFILLVFILGIPINYFFFIRSKLIYKINEHYQKQNRTIWKDNSLFILYILLIFLLMFIEVWVFKNQNN